MEDDRFYQAPRKPYGYPRMIVPASAATVGWSDRPGFVPGVPEGDGIRAVRHEDEDGNVAVSCYVVEDAAAESRYAERAREVLSTRKRQRLEEHARALQSEADELRRQLGEDGGESM